MRPAILALTSGGLDLARRLARVAAESGRTVRGLLQVDLAEEETKFGVPEAAVKTAAPRPGASFAKFSGRRTRGSVSMNCNMSR